MAAVHGIPLLSGSPPAIDSDACRKCNKEFNLFFTRSRKCNHCGYSYCHSCSDFQALLPRSGPGNGYDAVHVCGYCIELLNVTAAGSGHLRTMPLSKLKTYASSYNIDISRAVEKNDIIEAILRARGPNGCLLQSKEDFYRKNKVPNPHSGSRPRGLFSRVNPPPVPPRPPPPQGRSGGRDIPNPHPRFPQPQVPHTNYEPSYGASPQPQGYPYQTYNPSRQSQQHYNVPPYHHNFQRQPPHPPPQETRPRPSSRSNSINANRSSRPTPRPRTPPRQRTTSTPAPPPPQSPPAPVPTPTLDQLLVMTQSSIAALSVSVLKSILFTNHVNVTMVLEKSELVKKVVALVDDEKRERERQRLAEEAERFEEEERRRERDEAIRREEEEKLRKEKQRSQRATVEDVEEGIDEMLDVEVATAMDEDEDLGDIHQESSSSSSPPKAPSSPNHTIPSVLERSGLCVICQDEEANIAIVDCGHMVMCRACSELIMTSSKECPLCRTRIVTEARLLRIFKS